MPTGDRQLSMTELGRVSVQEYGNRDLRPIRLVLDNLRSRHNVGSVFRTADAFGIEGLVLCGFTPAPPHREIEKTALGATLSVPWMHVATTLEAVRQLKLAGYRVVAVEQTEQAVDLSTFVVPPDQRLALVLGNELSGVAREIIAVADACLTIPQHGSKHSLNVSVCAGIVLWQLTSGGLR